MELGRITENDVFNQLCVLNEMWFDLEIQFFIKEGFNYVNNTGIYDSPAANSFPMNLRSDDDALNLWCVGNAGGMGNIVTLGYYDPSNDWVVMANSEVRAAETELAHEMGHFFSIQHTHLGWDCEQYDEATHGNPVLLTSAPCNNFPVELQDGSNCEDSGDFICDTPPDYLFGLGWPGCSFTDEVRDRNGDIVDPDELNFMSYFLNCNPDDYFFSETQKDIVAVDYQSSSRNYLRRFPVENTSIIEDSPLLNSPDNDEVIGEAEEVDLDWTEVENADFYFVEVDRTPSFSFDPIVVITVNLNATIGGLTADTRYFWRVRGFNEYSTCADPSDSRRFRTSEPTATVNPELQTKISFSPNPITSGQDLFMRSESGLEIELIEVYNSQGKLLKKIEKPGQTLQIKGDFGSGMLIIRTTTAQGSAVHKITVI